MKRKKGRKERKKERKKEERKFENVSITGSILATDRRTDVFSWKKITLSTKYILLVGSIVNPFLKIFLNIALR